MLLWLTSYSIVLPLQRFVKNPSFLTEKSLWYLIFFSLVEKLQKLTGCREKRSLISWHAHDVCFSIFPLPVNTLFRVCSLVFVISIALSFAQPLSGWTFSALLLPTHPLFFPSLIHPHIFLFWSFPGRSWRTEPLRTHGISFSRVQGSWGWKHCLNIHPTKPLRMQ